MTNFLHGCDPEVFLSLPNKGFVSAHGLFPGTKLDPFKVEKGAIQVDGVALEFNITPASNADEFSDNIETVLTQMKEMVKKVDKDLEINFTPYAVFNVKYFNEEIDAEAKVLGCDPDYSSIDGRVIEKSEEFAKEPIRVGAGHYHVGWTENEDISNAVHFNDAKFVAYHFYCLGSNPINLVFDPKEQMRLRYYGAFGAFRPKPYGVELRQYSNRWVENKDNRKKMFHFVDNNIRKLYKG